jgi:hypothetical protein
MKSLILIAFIAVAGLCGCASRHYVIAATGTVLGVDVSQDPSTGLYHAKLGYARTETAIVPSNRSSGATNDPPTGQGAKDVAPVILEVKMANLFSGGGIYQRLAVGAEAVGQPGASFMFAKDASGNLSSNAADAVARSLATVPTTDAEAIAAKVPLAKLYRAATDRSNYDAAAAAFGYTSFEAFLANPSVAVDKVKAVIAALKAKGIPVP